MTDDGQVSPDGFLVQLPYVLAVDPDGSLTRLIQLADQVEHRGLPAAAGADQGHGFPGMNDKAHVVQHPARRRPAPPPAIGKTDVLKAYLSPDVIQVPLAELILGKLRAADDGDHALGGKLQPLDKLHQGANELYRGDPDAGAIVEQHHRFRGLDLLLSDQKGQHGDKGIGAERANFHAKQLENGGTILHPHPLAVGVHNPAHKLCFKGVLTVGQLHVLCAADHLADKAGVPFIGVAIDMIVRLHAAGTDGFDHGLNRQNTDHHRKRGPIQDQHRNQYSDFLHRLGDQIRQRIEARRQLGGVLGEALYEKPRPLLIQAPAGDSQRVVHQVRFQQCQRLVINHIVRPVAGNGDHVRNGVDRQQRCRGGHDLLRHPLRQRDDDPCADQRGRNLDRDKGGLRHHAQDKPPFMGLCVFPDKAKQVAPGSFERKRVYPAFFPVPGCAFPSIQQIRQRRILPGEGAGERCRENERHIQPPPPPEHSQGNGRVFPAPLPANEQALLEGKREAQPLSALHAELLRFFFSLGNGLADAVVVQLSLPYHFLVSR